MHDGNFITDGLMFPNRDPSPGAIEMKKTIEPLRITGEHRSVCIQNRLDFATTNAYGFEWTLEADGKVIDSGELKVDPIRSWDKGAARLPAPKEARGEKVWTVRAVLREDTKWGEKGHEVAWGQWACGDSTAVPPHAEAPASASAPSSEGTDTAEDAADADADAEWEYVLPRLTIRAVPAPPAPPPRPLTRPDGSITLGPAHFSPRGQLTHLGHLPVTAQLDIWRAPTDNDRGWDGTINRNQAEAWRNAGLDRMHTRVDRVIVGDKLRVETWEAPAVGELGLKCVYTWAATGKSSAKDDDALARAGLAVTVDVDPVGKWDELPLPRLGLRLTLPKSISDIEFFGLGPGESYPDSCAAVRLGRWKNTVDGWQTPYVMPQENGARRGVRWATLSGPEGGVRIAASAERPVILAARRWTSADLDAAKHTTDLVPGDHVYVNVDVSHHGLGTAACGPGPTEEYRNPCEKTSFGFEIAPVDGEGKACVVQ